jgi:glycine/D-amino acid oxidase-like deaminating enzyme
MRGDATRRRGEEMKDYRQYSMWLHGCPGKLAPRPALPGPLDVDVAIVGAGLTGLWTAYYLMKADPGLRVAVLEREVAGFGASGRNGGWCSSFFATPKAAVAGQHGRPAAQALQRAMYDTVDEVGRVVRAEAIDAGFHKGGMLDVATTPAQLERVRAEVEYERDWGAGEDDVAFFGADEVRRRIAVQDCLGAFFTPHCAGVDPARLTRGLADVAERLGAAVHERTPVTAITPHYVHTRQGLVHAEVVVRATEAFTPELPGHEREVVPIYSLMIATEPLGQAFWEEVGWAGREALTDGRHLIIYALRTEDDRVAIGGRGAPYHFGSALSDRFDRDPRVFGMLRASLAGLFPALRDARITHHWGGPLAVPRDWWSSVGLDRATGLAWAGGYIGDGVATANLAGRTLSDLIRGVDSDLVRLPWVGHRSRRWEPEPVRWLGVNLTLQSLRWADAEEARTGRQSRLLKLSELLIGR